MLSTGLPGFLDRKSTRLNSSYVEISYAVFCLKKKTYGLFPLPVRHKLHNATPICHKRVCGLRLVRRVMGMLVERVVIHAEKHLSVFFFNDTATTEIYTLSLHDALPI